MDHCWNWIIVGNGFVGGFIFINLILWHITDADVSVWPRDATVHGMLHSTLELLRPNVQRVVEAEKTWIVEHRHVEHVWTRKTYRVVDLIIIWVWSCWAYENHLCTSILSKKIVQGLRFSVSNLYCHVSQEARCHSGCKEVTQECVEKHQLRMSRHCRVLQQKMLVSDRAICWWFGAQRVMIWKPMMKKKSAWNSLLKDMRIFLWGILNEEMFMEMTKVCQKCDDGHQFLTATS